MKFDVSTITLNGETRTLHEWCHRLQRNYKLAYNRLRLGWPAEKAFDLHLPIAEVPVEKSYYPPDAPPLQDPKTGRFAPGHVPMPQHRKKPGTKNKITRDLKEAIIDAAVRHGSDGKGKGGLVGYLQFLATNYPKPFSSLLGRLLPLQVNGEVAGFLATINITAVPEGHFLKPEDFAQMLPLPPPAIIDGNPTDNNDTSNVTPFRREQS
jgi:hypothetical protein